MLKLEKTKVMNFDGAIMGARNPMNSWELSDSKYHNIIKPENVEDYTNKYNPYVFDNIFVFGPNDYDLAKRLIAAGSDHRKFTRQIFVSVNITAPLYWWKEYDTYKIGTVANSTSSMHKIHSKPFELDDFSYDHLMDDDLEFLEKIWIPRLEFNRIKFNETKDKRYWYNIIQLLGTNYNQMRTCTLSYENLINIYHARNKHKLDEWRVNFCDVWIKSLPYGEQFIVNANEYNKGEYIIPSVKYEK